MVRITAISRRLSATISTKLAIILKAATAIMTESSKLTTTFSMRMAWNKAPMAEVHDRHFISGNNGLACVAIHWSAAKASLS